MYQNIQNEIVINRKLWGEIDIESLLSDYRGPFYLYNFKLIEQRVRMLKKMLDSQFKLFYAVKANPNSLLLKKISGIVDGADISSGGELERVLNVGFDPLSLSFAGPGKSDEELKAAMACNMGSISVESVNELYRIEKISGSLGVKANIALRINPVNVYKNFAIKMGGKSSQFGVDEESASRFLESLKEMKSINFIGFHVFSGTQCLNENTLIENFTNTLSIVGTLMEQSNITPRYINFGGGFGIPYYEKQNPIDADYVCSSFAEKFKAFTEEIGLESCYGIVELGRFIVAEAGIYLAKIVDVKESRGRKFCVLDGGMNHHLPASGNFGQVIRKNFKIINLSNSDVDTQEEVNIVGPLCTSIDLMGDRVNIPKPEIGHHLAILNSGAYAYTASPLFFLSHKFPKELLYDENGEFK